MKWVTTDRIIAIGLVVALVTSLTLGGSVELQTTIAAGLIGYLSKDHATTTMQNRLAVPKAETDAEITKEKQKEA